MQISISNFRYFKGETAVTTKEFATGELTTEYDILFLDLTICPEYFAAYNKTVLQNYGIKKDIPHWVAPSTRSVIKTALCPLPVVGVRWIPRTQNFDFGVVFCVEGQGTRRGFGSKMNACWAR